jgi:hypothetical protein
VKLLARIARWKLLPLSVVLAANNAIWCEEEKRVAYLGNPFLIPFAFAILSGIATPARLQWFTAVCLLFPVIATPGYHGALIIRLWRDIQEFCLTSDFFEFATMYAISAGVVWIGYLCRWCIERVFRRS